MSARVTADLLKAGGKAYGCILESGVLKPFLSAVQFESGHPANVTFAGHAEGIDRFFLATPQRAYASGNGSTFSELGAYGGEDAFLIEDVEDGGARGVLVRGANAVAHTGSSFMGFACGVKLRCGVMHCGRLFGADAEKPALVRWSGEGGISDWTEGIYGAGSVQLDPERGEILNLLKLGENIVAVRKYGLSVMSMFGNTENFAVKITDTDTDEILKNTACAVRGKLYFLTRSGLCSYDGEKIERVAALHGGEGAPVCCAAFADRYYLALKNNDGGFIFCSDGEGGQSTVIRAEASAMCSADRVYCYGDGGAFTLENGGEYEYVCNGADFGSGGVKTLTWLNVGGVADVEVSNGRFTRAFKGASGKIRVGMRGREFYVTVRSGSPIDKLTVTAEVYSAI